MTTIFRKLETLNYVAPLALRFWDGVRDQVVLDGLLVTACRPGSRRTVTAVANRSGVYAFQHLPGLREPEQGAGDVAYWAGLAAGPPPSPYVVEVQDTAGRFLPCRLLVSAPRRGLYDLPCEPVLSPSQPLVPGVRLYSAPGRPAPAATAVVRAELWDGTADAAGGRPAAWAVVEVRSGSQPPALGIADADGHVAVIFAYPEPLQLGLLSSPAAPGHRPLAEQTWPVTCTIFYTPADPVPGVPDLCQALGQLLTPPATAWATLSLPTPLSEAVLAFGQDLTLKTAGESALVITRTGAPPTHLPPT